MSETNGNGKVTLRNSRIQEIHRELKAIPILKDHGKMVYALGRNINILQVFVDEIEDKRKVLVQAHLGDTTPQNGDPRLMKLNNAFQEVLDMKIEIEPFKFPVTDLEKAELSPTSCAAVLALIEL